MYINKKDRIGNLNLGAARCNSSLELCFLPIHVYILIIQQFHSSLGPCTCALTSAFVLDPFYSSRGISFLQLFSDMCRSFGDANINHTPQVSSLHLHTHMYINFIYTVYILMFILFFLFIYFSLRLIIVYWIDRPTFSLFHILFHILRNEYSIYQI